MIKNICDTRKKNLKPVLFHALFFTKTMNSYEHRDGKKAKNDFEIYSIKYMNNMFFG